ncbi:hypothetical protein N0V88_001102 [Collariella sp. IMI 366227]|nr:hypothetical protein N0V88_001102 [Collariella sp. IMI 366227]
MSLEILDAYWAAPPLARTLATAIVLVSLSAYFGPLPFEWLYFDTRLLFKFMPEIWRPVTSFLVTRPKISLIMDPYFAYQYMKQLELANPKFPRKEDLVWYLMTVGAFIMLINLNVFGGSLFFLDGLNIAMAYTANQDQRGQKTNFFFFTVPSQALPYCMILMSLLVDSRPIPLQISGILAAHLHDFLTRLWPEFGGGQNYLQTPSFVSYLMQTPRILNREYGTAIQQPDSGTSTGASTGSVLPDSWKTRGSGHRLG